MSGAQAAGVRESRTRHPLAAMVAANQAKGVPAMSEYGTLTDYTTGDPIRPATRDEWLMSVRSVAEGHDQGVWRDGDLNDGHTVFVAGGPEREDDEQSS